MHIRLILEDGRELAITTEHSASSYGKPVVLSNGELTDSIILVVEEAE